LAHSSTYRVYLRKSGETRVARMMDSPYHPYSDTRFTLNEKGTDDIEEGTSKKNRTNSKKPMGAEEELWIEFSFFASMIDLNSD
jgi:DNA repair protein RadA